MKCPVCGAPAVDIGGKDFDGKVFRCSAKCKDYEIAGTHMLKFLALSPLTARARSLVLQRLLVVRGLL